MFRLGFFILIASLFGFIQPATGMTDDKEIAQCAEMPSDLERLACYDDLAIKRGAVKVEKTEEISGTGKWTVNTKTSPIDDSTNVYVSLAAETPIKGWLAEVTPDLILRCAENKTEVYIRTGVQPNTEYGSIGLATITLRFDKQNAFKIKTAKSTDNKALFFRQSISFIKQMIDHKKMLFQFVPFNSSTTHTTFDIAGIKEAVKPIRKHCGW